MGERSSERSSGSDSSRLTDCCPACKVGSAGRGTTDPGASDRPDPDWSDCAIGRGDFIELVRGRGCELYRDLPWRGIDDPYGVLVSEVMLQQTQVKRVLGYWPRWMALFPTIDSLASADTATVLEAWQGLGYNRRALALHRACIICSAEHAGFLPDSVEELLALPGIGPATAAGVVAFAFNRPAIYLETNVRSVFLHELFPLEEDVTDRRIVPYIADTCPDEDPRGWYYALLDYGAYLKSQVANPSRRSRHHSRQSAFEGSRREKRSQLLKIVLASSNGVSIEEAFSSMDAFEHDAGRGSLDRELFEQILGELLSEGFFTRSSDCLFP